MKKNCKNIRLNNCELVILETDDGKIDTSIDASKQ